jgi:nicotinate-nucleotide adenylyltransferase
MMQNRKGIGLFGGTFDPVHIGHLIIAEWLSEVLEIVTTYFIPNKIHPFSKRKNITDSKLRMEMLQIAIRNYPQFAISDFELSQNNVSYTVETVRFFRQHFPDTDLYYFIGSDNLESFLEWKDPFEILEICYLVVYQRGNHNRPTELLNHPKVLDMTSPIIDISSSHIRKRVSKKMAFRSLVPEGIFEFITEKKLYK